MSNHGTSMLFAPPLPPLVLPEEGSVVMGRSKSCDLTIPSPDASRRHAEIELVDQAYLLRDLGSTNGTFVNGAQIQEKQLETGDRIDIGGELVTFCRIDPGLEAPEAADAAGEAKTRMMERPVFGECIRGSLAEIPPFAVLQMLEMGRKSGLLEIDDGDVGPGRLWLVDGNPVHSETKRQHGFDAAVVIVNASSGSFSFEPGRAPPEHTIRASVTELLLEASRQLDEGQ